MAVRIIETESQITAQINGIIADEINKIIAKSIPRITRELQSYVLNSIKVVSSTYSSLLSGILWRDFGLLNPQEKLDAIFETWSKNVYVNVRKSVPTSKGVIGGFTIGMVKSDYSDVLSLIQAKQETINSKGEVHILDWLHWLLIDGDKAVVREYRVAYGAQYDEWSRTKDTIMIPQVGGIFSVKPEFAGIKSNNWVTKTIDSFADADIENIFRRGLNG